MVNRDIQLITSKYGPRRMGFHKGVDLRTREQDTWKQLAIIAPERIEVKRVVYQKKWGYTIVVKALDSGGVLKFTHVKPVTSCKKGMVYLPGEEIGRPMVSEYMKEKGYGEHLHFERWVKMVPVNPVRYFKKLNIPFSFLR